MAGGDEVPGNRAADMPGSDNPDLHPKPSS
jgi:hypothetical protein